MKGAKKRRYSKQYYAANKDTISEKKMVAYQEELEKSCADSASRSKASYDKDPDSGIKSTVRSKLHYDKDIEKSRADSAARSKASYDKDPDSGMKSTVRLHYDKAIEKSRADSDAHTVYVKNFE